MGHIEILAGLLKRIEKKFSMNTLEKRMLLQKRVYFLQSFGLNLGYIFNYYLYGPYCKTLANEGFKIMKLKRDFEETFFIEKDKEEIFKKFLEFLGDRKSDEKWLEILSSLHLRTVLSPRVSKEAIIADIIHNKKYINKEDCERAWRHLEKYNLIVGRNE